MATFKIMRGTAKGKTWKAVGTNPLTNRQMTIQGGQAGKKYINKLRWDNKAKIGSTVRVPDELFKKSSR